MKLWKRTRRNRSAKSPTPVQVADEPNQVKQLDLKSITRLVDLCPEPQGRNRSFTSLTVSDIDRIRKLSGFGLGRQDISDLTGAARTAVDLVLMEH